MTWRHLPAHPDDHGVDGVLGQPEALLPHDRSGGGSALRRRRARPPRSEAASSSQIENLTASARASFSAELGVRTGLNAESISANTQSLLAAIGLSRHLTAQAIGQVHAVLMAEKPRERPGQWRQEVVWIGTRSETPGEAEFVAPHHTRMPALIDDLATFARRLDVPALTSVAVAHAQFETIHPFTDGNGRTGRALAQAVLRYRGVTRNVAVPVSAGLLADGERYHRALSAYRPGDGDSATAARDLGVQQPNVYPPLRALVEAGIVISKDEYQLGPFRRSDEVPATMGAFARRAGRREGP